MLFILKSFYHPVTWLWILDDPPLQNSELLIKHGILAFFRKKYGQNENLSWWSF